MARNKEDSSPQVIKKLKIRDISPKERETIKIIQARQHRSFSGLLYRFLGESEYCDGILRGRRYA